VSFFFFFATLSVTATFPDGIMHRIYIPHDGGAASNVGATALYSPGLRTASMRRVLHLTVYRSLARFSIRNTMMRAGYGKVDARASIDGAPCLPSVPGRQEKCRHGSKSTLIDRCHRHTLVVAGTCIYCMLLLAHPSCRLASAWSSSQSPHFVLVGARRHYAATRYPFTAGNLKSHSKVQTNLGADKTMEQHPLVDNDAPSLDTRIRDAYEASETDGILELARTTSLDKCSPQELIKMSLEAANNNKGKAAGMMNAWIASCYELREGGAEFALQLLQSYDEIADEVGIYPDVVTLSLVYSIACREDSFEEAAQSVLERAIRMSKKIGGSKRRKELAAARRRGPGVSCKDIEQKLQDLYGNDFKVLQETNDFVVIFKPSGMVCFHKHKTTAGRRTKGRQNDNKNVDVSLVDALLQHDVPLSNLNAEGRGLVHRIDRGTSGCIVLAKTDDAHAKLLTQFFLRRAKKSYTALVSSKEAIEPFEGIINMPVDGRPAKSTYSVLERYDNGVTKVKVETLTGRKHQVRVHCAKGLNSPILLDPIYGNNKVEDADSRFLLHASSLMIPEYEIDVEAHLPFWWEEAVSHMQQSQ